jgi:hypothetical protein
MDVDEVIMLDELEDTGGKKQPLSSPERNANDIYSLDLFLGWECLVHIAETAVECEHVAMETAPDQVTSQILDNTLYAADGRIKLTRHLKDFHSLSP